MDINLKDLNVKLIKRNAIVSLKVGAGTIEKLLEAIEYFRKNITEDQYKKYDEEVKDYKLISRKEKEFSEPWMAPLTTLYFLLTDIQIAAEQQDQTYEVNLEDYMKSKILSSVSLNDNLPADQSQSQPE